ncbi:hypothetical protein [Chitinophaga vietnamensis]|uniref:hypothetical protein n=1 Tax=Chitinophaga vietnamensis TaxID=2593957 RepID=UPI001178BE1C|nr:hypothetical protein [Chitinophaga vietnamensis]
MKSLYYLGTILLSCLLLFSCSKEMSREGTGPVSTCDYAPYTQGSTFTYLNFNQAKDSATYTLTVDGDTTINGNVYKKLRDDSVFMCSGCKDGTYSQVASIMSFQGFKASDLRLNYLKDFLPAGSVWKDTITASNGTIATTGVLQYTILGKGAGKTVNGKAYTDVITVQMEAAAIVGGNPVPVGILSTSYYAKGVGLIEADQAQDTTILLSYRIN